MYDSETDMSRLMEEMGLEEVEVKITPLENDILYFTRKNPSTNEEIAEGLKKPINIITNATLNLRRKEKLEAARMILGRKGKYSSHQLIGDLAGKMINYWPDDEDLLGLKVIKHISKAHPTGKLEYGEIISSDRKLRIILPRKSFGIVSEYLWRL